jgi:hypothetical protein
VHADAAVLERIASQALARPTVRLEHLGLQFDDVDRVDARRHRTHRDAAAEPDEEQETGFG